MIKTKSKKLILILLLIILTFSFCGCAEVRAMTITNSDGTIEEQVYVSLDRNAILKAGENVSKIKQDISSTAVAEGAKMLDYLNFKVEQDKIGATKETIEILNSFKNGIQVLSNNWDNNTSDNYLVSIKFKNLDVYKYYYDIEETDVETTVEEHFFYNRVSFQGSTMYLKHNELYNRLKIEFSVKYSGLINSESNQLLYTYTTDLRRQHSNADYITKQGGKYYHTWVIEDVNNTEILFYYNIANRGNCILVAMGVTLCICGIMFLANYIYKKNKKSAS